MRLIATALLFLLPALASAQALQPGDIAIVGLYHDGPDAFAVAAMTDLPTGTVISFTENGWLAAGAFRGTSEGTMVWNVDSPIAAGTVVTFTCAGNDPTDAATPSAGSVTGSLCGLSTSGDQILAYQGTDAAPTFIYAVNNEGNSWQADATSSNTSALPAGLTDGVTAVALPELDNYAYTGTVSGSAADLLAAIGNPANWTGNDDRTQAASFPSQFTIAGAAGTASVRWITPTLSLTEGDAPIWMVAVLSQNPAGNLSVNVTATGTATLDSDYTLSTTALTFAPGRQRDSVRVAVVDDDSAEGSESIMLRLTQPSAGLVVGAPATAELTILDNDGVTQQTLFPGTVGAALRDSLRRVYTPATLGYTEARRQMFGYVWNVDGLVEGLYTGFQIAIPAGSSDAITIASNKGFNTEHAWPQSKGAEDEPQRSNLFNLFPTRIEVNSDRGNLPFGEVPDAQATDWYRLDTRQSTMPNTAIDEWSERGAGLFEPREKVKGDVARSQFYFYTLYANVSDGAFFDGMKATLRAWHQSDGVSAGEMLRHDRIVQVQGKANPFVLDSSLARRAFFSGADTTTTPPPPAFVTIAQARQQGNGATVQVRGVVTRARGAFTYFQDETGGLVVRQTSGAFFDQVGNGQIAPGDSLVVEGVLSSFNNLLQINASGLLSYSVPSRGGVLPAPIQVTVPEILNGGEAYESRLIQVSGLQFSDTGTFAAARTYQATADGGTIDVRIGNAADTDVDGMAIPQTATFTGVVGQFSSSVPDAGYQLLPILASDLSVPTDVEAHLPGAFALRGLSPQPANATAMAWLDLPQSAQVDVAVFDLTGRQVMTLTDVVGSGRHVALPIRTASLAPGVYLYRVTAHLDAGERLATGRLVVVR